MPTNQEVMLNSKKYTLSILQQCDLLSSIDKGENLSINIVEKASCDLQIKLKTHPDVLILITSTNSFREDRLDIANTRMRRLKKIGEKNNQKTIGIVTSNCANERVRGDDSKLLNGYNFGDREEIGLDILVKTDDLVEILQCMSQVESKNDLKLMISVAKDCIRKKNY